MGFLTSTALVSSSFLIGTLFTSLLWDGTVLYGLKEPISKATIDAVESYYLTWWNGPMAVKMFLHFVMLLLFLSLVAKFARHSETAFYFSGGSLLMLILCASLYIVITIPSMRTIAQDPLSATALVLPGEDIFTRFQNYFISRNSGLLAERARQNAEKVAQLGPMSWDDRVVHVQVMCAANTLAMGLLVGVVLLQVSEWYLEETIVKEAQEEARKQELTAASVAAGAPVKVTEEKKKQ
ncbi:SPOSA6832_00195 [Sporobolomyces salmonicolor]|uniref:SPOSA6832_00195-mRNA-1:cds n=1 Tax=Sporidiobolus salmonicolor TaxID=5005 RepID=A0A0D6EG45_SPOSA|nr:SPOSA6832_00195 [Sporobolomyces salmonicolor]